MTTPARRVLGRMAAVWAALFFVGAGFRVLADCSSFGLPFTDLGTTGFCAQIAEAYYSGLSNGTSATAYSPSATVPREQMAAFVTRTLDQSLLRGNRRAAMGQWWNSTPHFDQSLGLTTVHESPMLIQTDGADVWVADQGSIFAPDTGFVARVRASDGKVLETWNAGDRVYGILVAMGRVFVTTGLDGGSLWRIDPSQPVGNATLTAGLGHVPHGIAFDGNNIWTAQEGTPGSVSIVTPGTWSVNTVTTGFSHPRGAVFDGANIWITDSGDSKLKKLDANGAILQSVTVGTNPEFPIFDGHNIWVPGFDVNTLTVVRASDGVVLKTFPNGTNGLSGPVSAAFDGQRILVTNWGGGLSLFKATDLSSIGTFETAGMTGPFGACSDGTSFFVSFAQSGKIGRF